MTDTSEVNAHNCSSYSDPTSENSEIESTFDDSDRDTDFSSSETYSSHENSRVSDFIYTSVLS